jgi:uncharacterized protein HemX
MFAALFLQAAPGVESALGALASHGILGIVAALAIGAAIWAVRAMREEMHLRVADATAFADRMEKAAEKDRASQAENARVTNALAEAQRETVRALERLTRAQEDNTRALEGTVRDAIRSRRSSESTQTMPAVRPDTRREPR